MKLIYKNKHGFALVEMVLVIAIIVILAAVLIMSVSTYISSARSRSNALAARRRSVITNVSENDAAMSSLGFGITANSNIQNHDIALTPTAAPTSAPAAST